MDSSLFEIELNQIEKKYGRSYILRGFNHTFNSLAPTVILGGNGSGKSTLLKLIALNILPGSGKVTYRKNHVDLPFDNIYRYIAFAAPYLDLIDEFTCAESFAFHKKFKPLLPQVASLNLLELCHLHHAADKQVKHLSSGMRQRLKLTLAILSDTPVLLLDEPCSNLDAESIEWYKHMINSYASHKLIIVCSNHLHYEFEFCTSQISATDFLKAIH